MYRAHKLGTLNGRRVYRYPVEVTANDSRRLATVGRVVYLVHSHSAADAANHVRDLFAHRPETEITAYGPQGGRAAYRFVGWESAIGHRMIARPAARQLSLLEA